jgi:ABC-2 type transport system permease protein
MKQFISFTRKEFYHIFRDLRTMMILLLMPVVLIILFGYAISTEIKRSPIAVWDQCRDEVSARQIARLQAGEYFELYANVRSIAEANELFRRGDVKMVVIFSENAEIQLLTDATDPNEATALTQYATAILYADEGVVSPVIANPQGEAIQDLRMAGLLPYVRNNAPSQLSTISLLYNPQMKGAYNFVPGVMGLILMLICAMMTSVGIVREKELGTMEVLLVSPLKPLYIILAKATPYLLISIVNIVTILLLSRFLLGVPIAGSVGLLMSFSVLYALVSLCLGLLISTLADTQQAAMLICGLALLLPVVLLSGMIFPVENMPWLLQILSDIVPAKWYITGVKDVMIKGLGASDILTEAAVLTGMALVLVLLSVKRFKIRL